MREERVLRQVRGHGGGYESGLDGQHVHAAAVDAVAHAVEKDAQRAFGCSVDVVALASAVSGYG